MTQTMTNRYAGMAEYYDLWVTSGYYNYEVMAKAAHDIAGDGSKVLELGVGTGLLVEEYLKLDPTCDFTGVDFAPSMLEIAYQRLPKNVRLEEADAVTMDLNDTYDVAISNGGVWGILDLGDIVVSVRSATCWNAVLSNNFIYDCAWCRIHSVSPQCTKVMFDVI